MGYRITGERYKTKKGGSAIGDWAREGIQDVKDVLPAIPETVKKFGKDVVGLFRGSDENGKPAKGRGHGALGDNFDSGKHTSVDDSV